MKIAEEKIDKLNSTLTIDVSKEDYQTQYQKALNSAKKEIDLPGFRPGKVPTRLVEKKYGRSILADELNKLINDSIYNHISENKIDILGNPIPKEDGVKGDWENPEDFTFIYEMGLAPEFDVNLEKSKIDYFVVKIDDKLLNKEVEDLRKRFGNLSNPEVSEADDLLVGTFVELNDDKKTIKEGGIMADSTISIEYVEDKKTKKSLTGLKAEDEVTLDPHKAFPNHADLERVLSISHQEVHDLKSMFSFKVKEVKRMNPAEINQELFDKAFGKDNVKNEDELKEKMKEVLAQNFTRDQDYIFRRDTMDLLLEKTKVDLPDEFMKRYIVMTNEKPITLQEIEAEYEHYAKSMKWQLIENKIAKENEVKVTKEDIVNFQKQALGAQYAQYGMPLDDEMLNEFAENSLKNKEEVDRVSQHLVNEKIIKVCKDNMKVKEKEISFDEFLKIAKGE